MNTKTETDERAKKQAASKLAGIVEILAAMYEAYDTGERVEYDGDDCTADDLQERIYNQALSVEGRTGWNALGTPTEDWWVEEYSILLCTGGPAVRIYGTIEYGQPHDATLQYQDWFTPWTDYDIDDSEERDALLAYAQTHINL